MGPRGSAFPHMSRRNVVNPTVVEVEFALNESELFVLQASDQMECEFELELLVPRSDDTVLEYVSVTGADSDRLLELATSAPGIRDARLVHETDEEALFELISESEIAQSLANEEAVFKNIAVSSGEGRLTAEIPPHIDASAVIDGFLDTYPDADLVARRETDRQAPILTKLQFMAHLVEDLTEKQMRSLRAAHANGYFEWPRDTRAEDTAEQLDISTPTFSEHMRVAQRKIFDTIFDE